MKFKDIKDLVQYAQQHPEHVYFTSDTHFYHEKIISLCKRPFESAQDMNDRLVENWNKTVGEYDVVFHLGDFCFGGTNAWREIRSRLNGSICLIRGNHDDHNLKPSLEELFEGVAYQLRLSMPDKTTVYLNHYPFLCFGGAYKEEHSVWQLFGHVHSAPTADGLDMARMIHLFPTQYDVGVDQNDFKPISWEEVKNKIKQQLQ